MAFKTFNYKNTQARIMRASFTGELGYEIYISPNHALELWETIFKCGKEFNLVPYGTETMHLLRAEKGYVVIGQETDGTDMGAWRKVPGECFPEKGETLWA